MACHKLIQMCQKLKYVKKSNQSHRVHYYYEFTIKINEQITEKKDTRYHKGDKREIS